MKKYYAYIIPEFQSYDTSFRLWLLFAFSFLSFLLYPVAGLQANTTANSKTAADQLTVTIENAFSSGWITCNNEKVTLVAIAYLNGVQQNPDGFSFSWAGPSGFKTTGSMIDVTVAGEYELTVQNASGLSASAKYLVKGVTGAAGPDKELRTSETSVKLAADSHPWEWFNFTPSWTASNGGNIVSGADTFTPIVDAPGTYTLTLTHTSGCTMQDAMVVTEAEDELHTQITEVGSYTGMRLGCDGTPLVLGSFVLLNKELVTEDLTYSWTGPNDFTSEELTISVTEPGIYNLEVKHLATGLTATSSREVTQLPRTAGSGGPDKKLTCDNPTVTLEGTSSFGSPIWYAIDGGNIVSGYNTLNPVVDAPGTYVLVLNSPKACSSEYTVIVTHDNELTVSATGGKLDCTTGFVQLKAETNQEGLTYSWTGPSGYTSSEQNPMVKVAGDYTLTVTNPESGCTASTSVVVTPASTELHVTNQMIDFNSEKRGLINSINTEAGPVAIMGRKRNADGSYAPENYAAIFDTQDPTGDDTNLYTVDWGHALIINEDQTDYPDATRWGGELILDFSAIGPVTMESLKVVGMDLYEQKSWVYLYDADGKELHREYLKPLGQNSKQTVNLGNTRGVMMMKVVLDGRNSMGEYSGSAAIDDIKFHVESTVENPCEAVAASNITHSKAYPTSFSEQATIEFIVRETENYTINLYDTQGMLIKQLQSGTARAGELTRVEMNGSELKEGMYLARLVSDSGSKTFKLILKR